MAHKLNITSPPSILKEVFRCVLVVDDKIINNFKSASIGEI
jgi:hypothetical protein